MGAAEGPEPVMRPLAPSCCRRGLRKAVEQKSAQDTWPPVLPLSLSFLLGLSPCTLKQLQSPQ